MTASELELREAVEQFMTTRDVSDLTRVPVETLRYWRGRGVGPAYVKPPGTRLVRYRAADVQRWLEDSTVDRAL
jgi:hypothetical protein